MVIVKASQTNQSKLWVNQLKNIFACAKENSKTRPLTVQLLVSVSSSSKKAKRLVNKTWAEFSYITITKNVTMPISILIKSQKSSVSLRNLCVNNISLTLIFNRFSKSNTQLSMVSTWSNLSSFQFWGSIDAIKFCKEIQFLCLINKGLYMKDRQQ